MQHLLELAEALQAAVVDQRGRMNFPSGHPLNQSLRSRPSIVNADVILGLEVGDFYSLVHSMSVQLEYKSRSIVKPDAKLISITAGDLYLKSNYQDSHRYAEINLFIAADGYATFPALI